jgi:hypothetical protein
MYYPGMCGYREFHILLIGVVAAGKTGRVALKNRMQGWRTDGRRKSAREYTRVDSLNDWMGELYRLGCFQAARRS